MTTETIGESVINVVEEISIEKPQRIRFKGINKEPANKELCYFVHEDDLLMGVYRKQNKEITEPGFDTDMGYVFFEEITGWLEVNLLQFIV